MIQAIIEKKTVITEHSTAARQMHDSNLYGALLPDGRIQLNFLEAIYLVSKKKITVADGKGKTIPLSKLTAIAAKENDFWTRYAVYKDFRDRGYIIKTALKFGADFRVYDKGVKPGEDHAKWIVYPVKESSVLTWQDFSAKNRVAHSTKKNLLIAVVDDEGDVSHWEVSWTRP